MTQDPIQELKELYNISDAIVNIIRQNIQIKLNLPTSNNPLVDNFIQTALSYLKIPIDGLAPDIAQYPIFQITPDGSHLLQTCKKCKQPITLKIIYNCGHSFCSNCSFNHCINNKQADQYTKCPQCLTPIAFKLIDTSGLQYPFKLNFTLKCPFSKFFCSFQSNSLSELQQHTTTCPYCLVLKHFSIQQLNNMNNYQLVQQKTQLNYDVVVEVVQNVLSLLENEKQLKKKFSKEDIAKSAILESSLQNSACGSLLLKTEGQQQSSKLQNSQLVSIADYKADISDLEQEILNRTSQPKEVFPVNSSVIIEQQKVLEPKQTPIKASIFDQPVLSQPHQRAIITDIQQKKPDGAKHSTDEKPDSILQISQLPSCQIDFFNSLTSIIQKYVKSLDINAVETFLLDATKQAKQISELKQTITFQSNLNQLLKGQLGSANISKIEAIQQLIQANEQQKCQQICQLQFEQLSGENNGKQQQIVKQQQQIAQLKEEIANLKKQNQLLAQQQQQQKTLPQANVNSKQAKVVNQLLQNSHLAQTGNYDNDEILLVHKDVPEKQDLDSKDMIRVSDAPPQRSIHHEYQQENQQVILSHPAYTVEKSCTQQQPQKQAETLALPQVDFVAPPQQIKEEIINQNIYPLANSSQNIVVTKQSTESHLNNIISQISQRQLQFSKQKNIQKPQLQQSQVVQPQPPAKPTNAYLIQQSTSQQELKRLQQMNTQKTRQIEQFKSQQSQIIPSKSLIQQQKQIQQSQLINQQQLQQKQQYIVNEQINANLLDEPPALCYGSKK